MEDFDEDGVVSGTGRPGPVVTRVEGIVVFTIMYEVSVFETKKKIVIAFVEVDYSESVNFGVTRDLFDHSVDDLAPALEAISVGGGICEHRVVGLPDGLTRRV